MKFALFLGCNIPARLPQYESSAKAVLENLGVELTEIKEFNCCGYPLRNIDFKSFVLASARNLALAEKEGLNIMSLCKCCLGSLKKVDHLLKENDGLREDVNRILGKEGLTYNGEIDVKHLLSVLYHDVGVASIEEKIEKPFEGLKIATHYGCHVLRPSNVVQFDDPVAPSIFDELVEVTGAQSIDWTAKLECCGAPLLGINDDLSTDLTAKKLLNGKKSGADYLCTACPYCQMQFDTVQKKILSKYDIDGALPSILFPQLLGLSMGIDGETLGITMNHLSLGHPEDFFAAPAAVEA
jgi:heterodisulfide reductase subunit B2